MDQFDHTRRLLNADVLDPCQAHAVTSIAELERIFALREQGATRFAGITGHDLSAPCTFLERCDASASTL
jgi:hypothetical protein